MMDPSLEGVPQTTKYGAEIVLQFGEHYIGSPLTSQWFSGGYAMPFSDMDEYNADYFRFEVLPTFRSKHQNLYDEKLLNESQIQPKTRDVVQKDGRPNSATNFGGGIAGPPIGLIVVACPMKENALREKRDNEAKCLSYRGRCLIYGHQIQLRHKLSGMYLTCSTTSVSPSDSKSLKCVFRKHSSINSFFSVLPASFSNVEGDIVHDKDFIFLQSSKPRGFLHVSDTADITQNKFSLPFRDINFSSLSSGFVLHNVDNVDVEAVSGSLQYGEMVQIYHTGFNAYLSIQDDNIVWLKVRRATLNKDKRSYSSRTYWVLERTDFIYKSPLQWGQPARIRHVLTNKTLSFNGGNDLRYQFVPASANDIVTQHIYNGTNVKIKANCESGDYEQWLTFSSDTKDRYVKTCLSSTFSYHCVLSLKRVGDRSAALCGWFSGLSILLQQLQADANDGFKSTLKYTKDVEAFLSEINGMLEEKKRIREIRKVCRDYNITRSVAQVCVTYIQQRDILKTEDFERIRGVIRICVIIMNKFLCVESPKNWIAVQDKILEVLESFIKDETFLEYLPILFKRNIYVSSSVTPETIEQFYQTHKILPMGDNLITFIKVLGMFCKYKTFCIAPNQNTISDLLLNESSDIAMKFGIRIETSSSRPNIQIKTETKWEDLATIRENESVYYELVLQRIKLYTILSWGNNNYVKSLIRNKIRFCSVEQCVAIIVENTLPPRLRRYFVRWLISLHIDTSAEGNRFVLPNDLEKRVQHPVLLSNEHDIDVLVQWVKNEVSGEFYKGDSKYGTRYDMIRLIDYFMRARILDDITDITMIVTRLFVWLGDIARNDVQKTAGKTVSRILRIVLYTADINLRILLETSSKIQRFEKKKEKSVTSTKTEKGKIYPDMNLITWVSHEVQSLNTFIMESTGIAAAGTTTLIVVTIRRHAQLLFSLLEYPDEGIGDSVGRMFVKFNLPVTEFLYISHKVQIFVTNDQSFNSQTYKSVTDDVMLMVMLTKTRLTDEETDIIIEAIKRINNNIIKSREISDSLDVQGLLYGGNILELCLTILLTPEVDLCSNSRNSNRVKMNVFWLLSYQMQGHALSQEKCFDNIERILTINVCVQELAFMVSRIFKDNAELCIKVTDDVIKTIATHASIGLIDHHAIFKILVNIIRGDEKDTSGININKDTVFNELLKNFDNINGQVLCDDKIKYLKHNLDEARYMSSFYNLLAWCAQGTENPIATICKGLLDVEETIQIISSPIIAQRMRRPFVRYFYNVFQDIIQSGENPDIYNNEFFWSFISNEFAMIDFVCKEFHDGKDQCLLEGVLYFTNKKKKYIYDAESEEIRENLKFICTVLLDVFISTFCYNSACAEEYIHSSNLATFSQIFEEFTLFIVPFVPTDVRQKIFNVMECLAKYKVQTGKSELITDEFGQVFQLKTLERTNSIMTKVNAPPYYRSRVSTLKLKVQEIEVKGCKMSSVIEKPFNMFVNELSTLLFVKEDSSETEYTSYSSVPYSHEIIDMSNIFCGDDATMEYRFSKLLDYLSSLTKRQFVDQSSAKDLTWSTKVYLRAISSLVLSSPVKHHICYILVKCEMFQKLCHLTVDNNDEMYREVLILFITVIKCYGPARDSILSCMANSNRNYFSRIFQEFRTAREASQESVIGGSANWLSEELQQTLKLTLLYCTALCQTHDENIQDIFLQQIYSSKSFNLIGELVVLIHYLCMRKDTGGIDVLAMQTLKCIISGNEENKENALEYGLSDTLNSIFSLPVSTAGTDNVNKSVHSVTNSNGKGNSLSNHVKLLEASYLLLYDLIEDSINDYSEIFEKLKTDIDTKALIQTIETLWDKDSDIWTPGTSKLLPEQELALEGYKIIRKMGIVMDSVFTEQNTHFAQYLGSIEIINNGKVEKLYFPMMNSDENIRQEVEDRLKWGLNRKTGTDKEIDFLKWAKEVIRDLQHQQKVKKYYLLNGMIALDNVRCWDYLVFIIALIIQIWMLVEWDFKKYDCLVECSNDNSSLLLNLTSNVCQNARFGSSQVCISFQYKLFLLICGILHLIASLSLACSYFVQNIPHFTLPCYRTVQDKEKKLMINILSFSPLYMLMVVLFSCLGFYSKGYFYCFHLLHMAWVNDLLRRVMSSVLRHWDQLLLCLPLAITVVYIYTLAFFANFRYIFEPSKMEYCNSLSECFVTLIKVSFRPSSGTNNLSWSNSLGTFTELWQKIVIDSTFFIIFVTVGLNVVTGIIIDGFRELKSERNKKLQDMQSRCTICDIDKDVFTKYDVSWDTHLVEEHNMWHYVQVFYLLSCKAEEKLSASEHYVLHMFNKQDIRFLPLKMSMSVENKEKLRK